MFPVSGSLFIWRPRFFFGIFFSCRSEIHKSAVRASSSSTLNRSTAGTNGHENRNQHPSGRNPSKKPSNLPLTPLNGDAYRLNASFDSTLSSRLDADDQTGEFCFSLENVLSQGRNYSLNLTIVECVTACCPLLASYVSLPKRFLQTTPFIGGLSVHWPGPWKGRVLVLFAARVPFYPGPMRRK